MKNWLPTLVAVVIEICALNSGMTASAVMLSGGTCACGRPLLASSTNGYANDHILVKLKPEEVAEMNKGEIALVALCEALMLPLGYELIEPEISRLARAGRRQTRPGSVEPPVDLDRFLYLRLPGGWDAREAVTLVAAQPQVEYAELDSIGSVSRITPSDPDFRYQKFHYYLDNDHERWIYHGMDTPDAWGITTGSTNVVVAVLDTGMGEPAGGTNPWVQAEFKGRLVPGYNFVASNSNTHDISPAMSHGTLVAAIIGANANNGVGGCGVDWQCRIMPLVVGQTNGSIFSSHVAQGVDFAVSNGCKVINFSGGAGDSGYLTLQKAITNALAKGVIFVAAAGNSGSSGLPYPASFEPVITVGASGYVYWKSDFSNYGEQLDLLAYGDGIYAYTGTGFYASGTSFAAPMVSGVCALLAAVRPDLNQATAKVLLCAAAEDRQYEATDTPGWDQYHGWGFLNAYYSLLLATTHIDSPTNLPDGRLQLSWQSPNNATNRQPFRLEAAALPGGPWTLIAKTNFVYSGNRATWTEPTPGSVSSNAATYFRLRIVLE